MQPGNFPFLFCSLFRVPMKEAIIPAVALVVISVLSVQVWFKTSYTAHLSVMAIILPVTHGMPTQEWTLVTIATILTTPALCLSLPTGHDAEVWAHLVVSIDRDVYGHHRIPRPPTTQATRSWMTDPCPIHPIIGLIAVQMLLAQSRMMTVPVNTTTNIHSPNNPQWTSIETFWSKLSRLSYKKISTQITAPCTTP